MKRVKKVVALSAAFALFFISMSCTQYTCPTYTKVDTEKSVEKTVDA
ncbi:hypothetical protein [Marinigracilibium pacificum]|uniref:Uncharacterized protein n=1 Tax=Marinigracilibium pacificum TaxID=2729599 RepID=A0A848J4U3_9BACT|nr:hypothetical protein [Marinigracilibium pacificum]NMM50298.1 hypothetical protein [Marinigracilibium pacificum]